MLDDAAIARLVAAVEQAYSASATLEAVHVTSLPHVVAGSWAEFRLVLGERVHAWFEDRGGVRSLTIASAPPGRRLADVQQRPPLR